MTPSNQTFSALLAFCARNSPVTGEFPTQRPVTRRFDVFLSVPEPIVEQKKKRRWFETPSSSLWRHVDAYLRWAWIHCWAVWGSRWRNTTSPRVQWDGGPGLNPTSPCFLWSLKKEKKNNMLFQEGRVRARIVGALIFLAHKKSVQLGWKPCTSKWNILVPGPRLNIKIVFPRYGDSHVKDKTVARPSYL